MNNAAPATLRPGTRAVVTVDIPDTWVGTVAAGTVVTIVDLGPDALAPGETYAAELADGRAVSFAADELSATPGAVTFLALVAEHFGPSLPVCPDGSGDLWWDDASYLRYQTFEPEYAPAFIQEGETANYCNGPVVDDCPF